MDGILRRCSDVESSTTTSEYKIGKPGRFFKGSIWIRPRKGFYRVQTTGLAQSLDRFITSIVGEPDGSQKYNEYKFWSTVKPNEIEKIIIEFDRSLR